MICMRLSMISKRIVPLTNRTLNTPYYNHPNRQLKIIKNLPWQRCLREYHLIELKNCFFSNSFEIIMYILNKTVIPYCIFLEHMQSMIILSSLIASAIIGWALTLYITKEKKMGNKQDEKIKVQMVLDTAGLDQDSIKVLYTFFCGNNDNSTTANTKQCN